MHLLATKMNTNKVGVAIRLFRKTERLPWSGCWIWMGTTLPHGYGTITLDKRKRYTHRVAWECSNGPIPDGLRVCHRCDTPQCVNPAHLFIGTAKDNTQDSVAKGRMPHGERHYGSLFTDADIRNIRSDSRMQKEIAADYGTCSATIGLIKRRVTWRHV